MAETLIEAVESILPTAGSIGVLLPGLVRRLAEADVRSVVVTGDADPPALDRARVVGPGALDGDLGGVDGCSIIHVHGVSDVGGVGDVSGVIAVGDVSDVGRRAVKLGERLGVPVVLSPLGALDSAAFERMSWWQRRRSRARLRAALDRVQHLAAINDHELGDLRAWSPRSSSSVLEYGIDFDEYANLPADRVRLDKAVDRQVMLVMGPIHPVEGLVPLLYAFGGLIHELAGWHLVLAGPETADWRMQLESTIRRKGGEARVTFVSDPDLDDQRSLLARASLVVVPALQVRPPTTILQAVAAEVPVIASDRVVPNALRDFIATCPPARGPLADALRRFLQQTAEQRSASARRAREMGRRAYDWSILAPTYVDRYRAVAAGGSSTVHT